MPTAGAGKSADYKRMRKYVILGSVGLSMLSSGPLFWHLGEVINKPTPVRARSS